MEELDKQVEAGAGAVPEGTGAAGATSSEATTEGTQAPSVEAQIKAEVQKLREEYEGKGGHLAKLRSSYDAKIAEMRRQLQQQTNIRYDEALKLADTEPAKAVQILTSIVRAQAEQAQRGQKAQEIASWQKTIMGDYDYDLDGDEEAAAEAAKWAAEIDKDPMATYDFQQKVGVAAYEREKARADKADKELAAIKESLAETIKAEVTRVLVSSGLAPDVSGGGAPPKREDNWRKKSTSELIAEGLKERMERAKSRT